MFLKKKEKQEWVKTITPKVHRFLLLRQRWLVYTSSTNKQHESIVHTLNVHNQLLPKAFHPYCPCIYGVFNIGAKSPIHVIFVLLHEQRSSIQIRSDFLQNVLTIPMLTLGATKTRDLIYFSSSWKMHKYYQLSWPLYVQRTNLISNLILYSLLVH